MSKVTSSQMGKRKSARIPLSIPANIKLDDPTLEERQYRSRSYNISRDGICLQTRPFEEEIFFSLLSGEKKLIVDFKLKKDNFTALGEITWAKEKETPFGKKSSFGVKFIDLPEDKREQIASYILKDQHKRKSPFIQEAEDFLYKKVIKNIMLLSRLGKRSVSGEADSGLNFDHMYKDKAEGNGLVGRFIDKTLLSLPAVQATQNRKRNIINIFRNEVENNKILGKKTKVLDLASGPARYLIELVAKHNQDFIEALCIDTDRDSLNFGKKLAGIRPIRYIQKNILNLRHLEDVAEGNDWKPNAIIISGLFVYQPDHIMKRILKECYEFLEEDGIIIFSNQLKNPSRKLMEKACSIKSGGSWTLFYRLPNQVRVMLLELGYRDVSIELDNWGMYYLARARK